MLARWRSLVCGMVLCGLPGVASATVWLEQDGQVIMSCKEQETGVVTCYPNQEGLAKYVKCHEQMKDALRLMNQVGLAHSEDPPVFNPTRKSAHSLREEAAKVEQQDQAIDFIRETLQRCAAE